jgi:formate hydrogenlyase transcriptional activator
MRERDSDLVKLAGQESSTSTDLGEQVAPSVFFEQLFELSPDAIFLTDQEGKIQGTNGRAEELFGYSRAELLNQSIEKLIPERFRKNHPAHVQKYNSYPRTRFMGVGLELFALRKDGSELPVDIMLKPVNTTEGTMVLSFVRDVSEQRLAQDALLQSEHQLRSMMESIKEYAIFLLDPEGRISSWNPGAERIKGYKADEIVGKHFSIFYTDEELEPDKPADELRIASLRGKCESEGWRIRKDGSRFWANIVITAIHNKEGQLTGFVKVTRDFTDRKRAEEALLLQLSNALLTNVDIRKLLSAISATIEEMVPHDCATLSLHEPTTHSFRVQFLDVGKGTDSNFPEISIPMEGSVTGAVFRTREPMMLYRIDNAPFAGLQHLTSMGMRSGCWVPLINRERAIGALTIASRKEAAFTQWDMDMLSRIAAQIATAVDNALTFRKIADLRDKLKQEKQYLEDELRLEQNFEDIVGESTGLRQVLKQIETVAPTNATVLIQGETGTGKELLARAIHRLSPRRERTFIKLNCAAIPAGLLESELFGHEKGAFTGAISQKMGRLELAHEGTLFLDEVGELPLELQPKLLRALQEREIERVGGTRSIPIDVRLVAATNRDLAKLVAEREFRSDLYYRLRVFPVLAPPLRERRSDIPILVQHFVAKHSRRMGKSIESIPSDVMAALTRWTWPGNIRELENFIERAVILSRGSVFYAPLAELELAEETGSKADPTLETAERDHILRVLRQAKGMIGGAGGAAEKLGLKRTTLNSKMKKLGIERRDYI